MAGTLAATLGELRSDKEAIESRSRSVTRQISRTLSKAPRKKGAPTAGRNEKSR